MHRFWPSVVAPWGDRRSRWGPSVSFATLLCDPGLVSIIFLLSEKTGWTEGPLGLASLTIWNAASGRGRCELCAGFFLACFALC